MADEEADEQLLPPGDDPEIAAERGKLRKKRERALRADEEAAIFWRGVFADPVGRRELWQILDAAHAFDERFACGPNGFPQDLATWYQAGERDVGQRLWRGWLRLAPDGVMLMMREHDPMFREVPEQRRARRVRGT